MKDYYSDQVFSLYIESIPSFVPSFNGVVVSTITVCPIDSGPTLNTNEYGSIQISQVRVQVPVYGSNTRDLFRSRFPSTGPGSQVRVQIKNLAQYRLDIR